MIDNGGPAFPRPVSEDTTQGTQDDGNRTVDPQDGMSLRDWFAGQALSALAESEMASEAARSAYAYADAMLVARRGSALRSTAAPREGG